MSEDTTVDTGTTDIAIDCNQPVLAEMPTYTVRAVMHCIVSEKSYVPGEVFTANSEQFEYLAGQNAVEVAE